jgi:hypothetical protein
MMMIFDIIKYGTFTADDFINAHRSRDFSKFTFLPIELRKRFISDVLDLYPNKESMNFKQAAFDFIDEKITEEVFREIWRKYWLVLSALVLVAAAAAVAVVAAAAVAVVAAVAADYYRPYFEKHASHLNKLISEYEEADDRR